MQFVCISGENSNEFPGHQEFYSKFLLHVDKPNFLSHLRDSFICEIYELQKDEVFYQEMDSNDEISEFLKNPYIKLNFTTHTYTLMIAAQRATRAAFRMGPYGPWSPSLHHCRASTRSPDLHHCRVSTISKNKSKIFCIKI